MTEFERIGNKTVDGYSGMLYNEKYSCFMRAPYERARQVCLIPRNAERQTPGSVYRLFCAGAG